MSKRNKEVEDEKEAGFWLFVFTVMNTHFGPNADLKLIAKVKFIQFRGDTSAKQVSTI